MAAGIKKLDTVYLPSYTFISTLTPLLWIGATPILGEITGPGNLNLDPAKIPSRISIKAITFVHIAGFMNNIHKLADFCGRENIILIEDCSHAHGSTYRNKYCGHFGKIAVFSLFANKNMTTGEGGIIVTNDTAIYENLKLLRSHGMTSMSFERFKGKKDYYDVIAQGFNYRATEIQAAIGRIQLKKLMKNNERRKILVGIYRNLLADIDEINVPFNDFRHSANYIFPVIVNEKRDEIVHYLSKAGIQTSWHYKPIHKFTYYSKIFKDVQLPLTEDISNREITLPLYPDLTEHEVEYVVSKLKDAIFSIRNN